jgi:hypothetical protein
MAIHRLSAFSPYMHVLLMSGGRSDSYVALIDTGASMTAVHPNIITVLNPRVIGVAAFSQVGRPQEWVPTYDFQMCLNGDPTKFGVEVIAAIPASPCQVLIGRDLMRRWLMVYDGPTDSLIISY